MRFRTKPPMNYLSANCPCTVWILDLVVKGVQSNWRRFFGVITNKREICQQFMFFWDSVWKTNGCD